MALWQVIVLGLIEGLTEFIPVSSTGHLLLVGHFLGFESPGKSFEVLIQLGAILAITSVYAAKLLELAANFRTDPTTRHFVFAVGLAFLPAAVVGAPAHTVIESALLPAPLLRCSSVSVPPSCPLPCSAWLSPACTSTRATTACLTTLCLSRSPSAFPNAWP